MIDLYFGIIQYKTSKDLLENMYSHFLFFFEVYLEAGRKQE